MKTSIWIRARHAIAQLRRSLAEFRVRRGQSRVHLEAVTPISSMRGVEAAPPVARAGTTATFDAARAFATLREQCDLGARVPGSVAHDRARAMIVERLVSCADEVAVQRWQQKVARGPGAGRTFALCNVLARFRGANDTGDASAGSEARAKLMLSAHWDTRPVADHDPNPDLRTMPVLGASDGASGVAVLLELARVLSERPPRDSTILAFWDGEDFGEYYYGSRLFARMLKEEPGRRWRASRGIVIDMIGGRQLRCTEEQYSIRAAPRLWAEVHDCASALGVAQHFHGAPGWISDDHLYLNRAGIPTVLLIDYSYAHWHTTHDVPEQCDPRSLAVIGSVLERMVFGGDRGIET